MTHFSLTEKRERRNEGGKEGKKRGGKEKRKKGQKEEGKKEKEAKKECKCVCRLKKLLVFYSPPTTTTKITNSD